MWGALASYAVATAMFGFGVTFFKDTLIRRALLVSTCGLGAQVVSLGVRWARVGHGPYLGFYEVANALVLCAVAVSYTHLRAHETKANLVCRLLLEKKKKIKKEKNT